MTKIYMRVLLVLVFAMISLSAVHGDANNSSYIYSDNLSSNNSDNKTLNNSDNKTLNNDTLDNNYNQTTIDKREENKTIAHDKKEPINDTATKSRVVIRKYVKSKNTPGFDSTTVVLVIMTIIIYMSARKR